MYTGRNITYQHYCYNAEVMETNNVRKYISSNTSLYFDKHIGMQLAVELHDEMHINISTDKHTFCE